MVRKMRNKKPRIIVFVALPLLAFLAVFVYQSILTPGNLPLFEEGYEDSSTSYSSSKLRPDSYETSTVPVFSLKKATEPDVFISLEKLNSTNGILVGLKDYSVVMQKNSEEKIYPASLTKMMTALVAIENLVNLQQEIILSHSTFQGLYEANASMAGFQPGEQVRAIDLLYGVMLPSGAESCIGLAEQIAGSEQDFVKLMNQKAAELGMRNTHFENTTGLHHENHYTTVKDLAILLSHALQNDTFREIFTTSRHSIPPTNKHPGGITFYNTLFTELNPQYLISGAIIGGKTGYTKEAGLCLASLAKVGKQEYILITAGAKGNPYTQQYNVLDALAVYTNLAEGSF